MRHERLGWLLALSIVAGCDWVTEVETEQSPRGAEAEPGSSEAAEARTAEEDTVGIRPSSNDRPTAADYQPPPPAEEAPGEGAGEEPAEPEDREPEDREPERDLSAELRELVGNPSSCLTDLSPSVTDVTVRVRASTSVTGIVTRSSVSGGGLSEGTRECVRRRLDGARFRSPVPEAPRDVLADLTLHRDSPPARAEGEGEGEDQARGTWRYGVFYPGGVPGEDDPEE